MSRLGANGLSQPIGGTGGPVAYTPVVTWAGNTITTQSGFYLKTPGKLDVWVSFVETVGTAAASVTITIPTGYTVVTHTGSLDVAVGIMTSAGFPREMMVALSGATTSIRSSGSLTGGVGTWTVCASIPTTS